MSSHYTPSAFDPDGFWGCCCSGNLNPPAFLMKRDTVSSPKNKIIIYSPSYCSIFHVPCHVPLFSIRTDFSVSKNPLRQISNQNIIFYVPQKKKLTQVWNDLRGMTEYSFWLNFPFTSLSCKENLTPCPKQTPRNNTTTRSDTINQNHSHSFVFKI